MREQALEMLIRYYTHLSLYGYMAEKDICIALLYNFIIKFIENYENYCSVEDLIVLLKLINSLEGCSCIIPTDNYVAVSDLITSNFSVDNDNRITEDEILRLDLGTLMRKGQLS